LIFVFLFFFVLHASLIRVRWLVCLMVLGFR
jgi:hypothetical protein